MHKIVRFGLAAVAALDVLFGLWFVLERLFGEERNQAFNIAGIFSGLVLTALSAWAFSERESWPRKILLWTFALLFAILGGLSWLYMVLVPIPSATFIALIAAAGLAAVAEAALWDHRWLRIPAGVVLTLALIAGGLPLLFKPSKPAEPVHLVLHYWLANGTDILGYQSLAAEFEAAHPGLTVELRTDADQESHHTAVTQKIAAGSGLADVVAVELRTMGELYVHPTDWVDLNPLLPGIGKEYAPFRVEGGQSPDGSKQIGLPVDLPGLAMCYRRDLFEAAGLPADRDAVSALWPSWPEFSRVGRDYRQRTGKAFLDSVRPVFEAMAVQHGDPLFYDRSNVFTGRSSQSLKAAWAASAGMIADDLSARAAPFTEAWAAGAGNGDFAATACPAWMLGKIEGDSGPTHSGHWDIAALPGGGANWGGTWLAVPKQSEHPVEAAQLAKFLTSQHGGVASFSAPRDKALGPLFPANLKALASSEVQQLTLPYFSNAPVGKIFTLRASTTRSVYLGPRYGLLRETLTTALGRVEQPGGGVPAEEAWEQGVNQVAGLAQ